MSKKFPARPSLRNLKIQAKSVLKACRRGDLDALRRIADANPKYADLESLNRGRGLRLADVQWALAREYGFDSWAKLVAALPPDIKYYRKRRFESDLSLQVGWIARNGANDPCGGGEHTVGASTAGRGHADVPDCRVWFVEPDSLSSHEEWDALVEQIGRAEVPGLFVKSPIDDAAATIISELDDLRYLSIQSGERLTDKGMRSLGRLTRLEYLNLGGYGGLPSVTDAGFECLEAMPELKSVRLNCLDATDESLRYLRDHQALRLVSVPPKTGDKALEYLKNKPELSHLFLRSGITDEGLAKLRDFPALAEYREHAEEYRIIEYSPPVRSALFFDFQNPNAISDRGLEVLARLQGLEELLLNGGGPESFSSRCLDSVARLSKLKRLQTGGPMIDDHAMDRIAELPQLESVYFLSGRPSDDGLEKLSRSQSIRELGINHFADITSSGMRNLGSMGRLETLNIGIRGLALEAFVGLKELRHLKEFNPFFVGDDAFECASHVESLERITIMYCDEVTDEAVRHLERLPNLKSLSIWSGSITDASCESICRIKNVEELLFYRRGITDAGIKMLATLPSLKSVDLQENLAVSSSALKAFRKGVRVNYQQPPDGYIRQDRLRSAVRSSGDIDMEPIPIKGEENVDFKVVNMNPRSEYRGDGIRLMGRGAGLFFPHEVKAPFRWSAEVMPLGGRWSLLFGNGKLEMPCHHDFGRLSFVDPISGERESKPYNYASSFERWVTHTVAVDVDRLRIAIGDDVIVDRSGDYEGLSVRFGIEFRGSLEVRGVRFE